MKIRNVTFSRKAKFLEIETSKGKFRLPFARLRLVPSSADPIESVYVDDELGKEGVTYKLRSGKEDSVHGDAFLDFNRDRDYLKKAILHQLSIKAGEMVEKSRLSKNQICRTLETSASHLSRLLEPSFYGKSIDQMVKLLSVLDCEVTFNVKERAA